MRKLTPGEEKGRDFLEKRNNPGFLSEEMRRKGPDCVMFVPVAPSKEGVSVSLTGRKRFCLNW